MVILFYSPFNQRSRDTETIMLAFKKQGHKVISLTQQEGYLINEFLNSNGVEAFSMVLKGSRVGWWYFLRHIFYFIRFCWKNNVQIVYSHLEPANFVASVGQFFIRAKVYLCRHHIDEAHLYGFQNDLYYKITYRLAKKIIVVSDHAKRYMIEKEKIPAEKVIHINLAYDFSLYELPNVTRIETLKSQYSCELLLIAVCRLTKYKRPDLAIDVVSALIQNGLNAKLIILGKGELKDALEQKIHALGLTDHVFLPGHVQNVLEYISASDFLIHPSILDSSCVAVKEAGLVAKPVIVCKGIGDFEDYITHGVNGFLVDGDNFVSQTVSVIQRQYTNKEVLSNVGLRLQSDVRRLFSVDMIVPLYDSLNK